MWGNLDGFVFILRTTVLTLQLLVIYIKTFPIHHTVTSSKCITKLQTLTKTKNYKDNNLNYHIQRGWAVGHKDQHIFLLFSIIINDKMNLHFSFIHLPVFNLCILIRSKIYWTVFVYKNLCSLLHVFYEIYIWTVIMYFQLFSCQINYYYYS